MLSRQRICSSFRSVRSTRMSFGRRSSSQSLPTRTTRYDAHNHTQSQTHTNTHAHTQTHMHTCTHHRNTPTHTYANTYSLQLYFVHIVLIVTIIIIYRPFLPEYICIN